MRNYVYIILGSSIFFTAFVVIIARFLFQIQKKNKRHKAERELLAIRFQQELLQSQLEIQEQTLSNIAQEIHDNIGQTLSLAKLNLNTPDMDDGRELKLTNTKESVSKAIGDLRSLSKTLNADTIIPAGLLKALEYELVQITKTGVFKTQLNVTGETTRLSAQKELILFRIVQESLNNIIKHSGGGSIVIDANYTNIYLEIIISDNGKGFTFSEVSNSMENGSGLRNMKKRASLIGGNLEIKSQTGKGTEITVTTPIKES